MLKVSNDSLSTYQTCQKKWQWKNIEGLEPLYKTSALTLGSIIHKAFDKSYNNVPLNHIIKYIDDTYKQEMSKVSMDDREQLYLDSKTALGMFLNFPFNQMKFEDISSEETFQVSLDKDVTFVGRVDGKVKRDGKWWIREVKTTSESNQMFEKRAAVSSQATGYVYGIGKQDNIDIQGIIYDFIRKPKLIKRMNECAEEFGQRIYLDYCNLVKRKSYFGRYSTYRSPKDIERWEDDAKRTATQIQQSIDKKDYPRNTNSCYAYNKECPYFKICFMDKLDDMIVELFYERRNNATRRNGK